MNIFEVILLFLVGLVIVAITVAIMFFIVRSIVRDIIEIQRLLDNRKMKKIQRLLDEKNK